MTSSFLLSRSGEVGISRLRDLHRLESLGCFILAVMSICLCSIFFLSYKSQ